MTVSKSPETAYCHRLMPLSSRAENSREFQSIMYGGEGHREVREAAEL